MISLKLHANPLVNEIKKRLWKNKWKAENSFKKLLKCNEVLTNTSTDNITTFYSSQSCRLWLNAFAINMLWFLLHIGWAKILFTKY